MPINLQFLIFYIELVPELQSENYHIYELDLATPHCIIVLTGELKKITS
jgi:hypothetical protein